MPWKAFHFEQSDTRKNSKNIYYGLTNDKAPSFMKLLELFAKYLFKIKFRKIYGKLQDKINSDIKDITLSRKTLTPADKKSKFEQLLHNSITKTYKKPNSNITKAINE